jgi:hypothetical protein
MSIVTEEYLLLEILRFFLDFLISFLKRW